MTEEQIVKAVHAAHATGRVALTFIDQNGVEKPTNVLQTLLRELQAASAAPDRPLKRLAKGWQQCPSCDRQWAQMSEDSAFVKAHREAEKASAAPAQEDAKRYRDAIAIVCEGWTLPDDARKVLETALWSATHPA